MWINLDVPQLEALKRILAHAEIGSAERRADTGLIRQRIAHYEGGAQRELTYIAAARDLPFARAGECEIDDDAVVSASDDGAYVMAWVWVTREEPAITGDDQGDDGPFVARII
ncbi:hypothetical protein [Sphingomonas panacis]|nr:hypothetical protein [Sphingomonas panacis]